MGGCVGIIYADPSPNLPPKAMLRRITPSGRECGSNDASLRDTGNGSCCERKAHARQISEQKLTAGLDLGDSLDLVLRAGIAQVKLT